MLKDECLLSVLFYSIFSSSTFATIFLEKKKLKLFPLPPSPTPPLSRFFNTFWFNSISYFANVCRFFKIKAQYESFHQFRFHLNIGNKYVESFKGTFGQNFKN